MRHYWHVGGLDKHISWPIGDKGGDSSRMSWVRVNHIKFNKIPTGRVVFLFFFFCFFIKEMYMLDPTQNPVRSLGGLWFLS